MKRLLLFLIFFTTLSSLVLAQSLYEYPRTRFGIEAGIENIVGTSVKPSAIRESQSYYQSNNYDDYGLVYNNRDFVRWYVGLITEYSLRLNFAVSAGVRYSFGESSLDSDRDNFLWRISESEQSDNYLRIKSIYQNIHSIGIPVVLTCYTSRSDMLIRHYFKVGAVCNFSFAQDVSINFANKSMEKYLPEIKNQFEKPDLFNAEVVFATGLKIGRMKQPFGNIELQMPVQFNRNAQLSSLVKLEQTVGFGINATFFIPFGEQKLSYTY